MPISSVGQEASLFGRESGNAVPIREGEIIDGIVEGGLEFNWSWEEIEAEIDKVQKWFRDNDINSQ